MVWRCVCKLLVLEWVDLCLIILDLFLSSPQQRSCHSWDFFSSALSWKSLWSRTMRLLLTIIKAHAKLESYMQLKASELCSNQEPLIGVISYFSPCFPSLSVIFPTMVGVELRDSTSAGRNTSGQNLSWHYFQQSSGRWQLQLPIFESVNNLALVTVSASGFLFLCSRRCSSSLTTVLVF